MAHLVKFSSPLHEQVCVAGSTVLGGAVGAWGGPIGAIVGAGVGFIIGRYVCGLDSVSGWFKDKFDFSVQITALITTPESRKTISEGLVAAGIVKDESEASTLLNYIAREINRDPDKYFQIAEEQRNGRGPAAGKEKHGIFILGSQAAAATARPEKA